MSEVNFQKEYSEYQKQYIQYLKQWDWQWSVHFFAEGFSTARLEREFQLWCRALGQQEHLYICAVPLQNYQHTNHLHALVLGGNASSSKTLADVDSKFWEEQWSQNAMIKTVHKNSIGYMVMKNTPPDFHVWLHEIGINKLQQLYKFKQKE